MRRIQYAVPIRETGNASGKAKKDAYMIALRLGFQPSYSPSLNQKIRVFQQIITLPKFKGRKVIFFQYPAVSEQLMGLFKKVISQDSFKIALIHDLSSIQGFEEYELKKELEYLNIFDCLIVHNTRMKEYVLNIGYRGEIVILDLFDYLHDEKRQIMNQAFSNSISFAGNLSKAKFLQELTRINKCKWILYGITNGIDFSSMGNVEYKGLLPSDEIQYLMEGDYGLVWDGDSLETCSGPNGNYLKYNNPHKLSCCIAAGKPIITWKQAAIADFVERNKIGITVNSLEELNEIDLHAGYNEMRLNVLQIKTKIANGKYLEMALNEALTLGGQLE